MVKNTKNREGMTSMAFHSFCKLKYQLFCYSMGGAIIWERDRAGSRDLADIFGFQILHGVGKILQF